MILLAVVSLVLGICCGQWLFSANSIVALGRVADYALSLLMLSVGISVGANRLIFRKLREKSLKILVIPCAIVLGSMLGGYLAGLVFGMNANVSVAISCGLGWYSLSGVMMTRLAGAQMGTLTFLANVFREIISFLIIPFVAKYCNHYTAIAPAGATSEDTTLPMIMKCTNEEIAVVAVLNGMLCSFAVPFLVELSFRLL